jgi:hypothetical protein
MRSVRWLWLALMVTMTGCNTVHSAKPLFGPEDVGAAPPLRPGLWLARNGVTGTADDDCPFDPNKPLGKWPVCASWVLVREADTVEYDRDDKTWRSTAYLLVDGRPRVLQVTRSVATDEQGQFYGDEALADYEGLAPMAHDAAGRIIAFRLWAAQCGPPDHIEYPENSGHHPTTLAPLPGLAMTEDGQNCLAEGQDAVRRSVAASEAWSDDVTEAYWVRDVRPDDFAR